ncbi:hypothetical protein ZWY2020_047854 [Hordeum vulgare]|nr:hypothetical protein ZWY2020_047854 [Hordeum vulgare]
MQTPDWAISKVPWLPAAGSKDGRGKNARKITRVLLLKAHRTVGKLTSAAIAALSVTAAAQRRVAAGRTNSDAANTNAPPGEGLARLLGVLCAFLLLFVLLLAVNVAAHAQGSHLAALPDLEAVEASSLPAMRPRGAPAPPTSAQPRSSSPTPASCSS